MTKTPNYQLPQWEAEDPICRADFNSAMGTIDTNLKGVSSAADTAQTAAAAAYSPSNKPYVVGSYTGTGSSMAVTLGFRPSLVIISSSTESAGISGKDALFAYSVITAGGNQTECITLTDTGFTVTPLADANRYPKLAEYYRRYEYIAFR